MAQQGKQALRFGKLALRARRANSPNHVVRRVIADRRVCGRYGAPRAFVQRGRFADTFG